MLIFAEFLIDAERFCWEKYAIEGSEIPFWQVVMDENPRIYWGYSLSRARFLDIDQPPCFGDEFDSGRKHRRDVEKQISEIRR